MQGKIVYWYKAINRRKYRTGQTLVLLLATQYLNSFSIFGESLSLWGRVCYLLNWKCEMLEFSFAFVCFFVFCRFCVPEGYHQMYLPKQSWELATKGHRFMVLWWQMPTVDASWTSKSIGCSCTLLCPKSMLVAGSVSSYGMTPSSLKRCCGWLGVLFSD